MNPDEIRYLQAKPWRRLRRFAESLGWKGLQQEWLRLPADANRPASPGNDSLVVYYMTTDLKFNLQINESPVGCEMRYQATVKADRYGILHVGWHSFELFEDDARLAREVTRLRPWLGRRLYRNRCWLRHFKLQHPETLLPSRKKRRGYQISSAV